MNKKLLGLLIATSSLLAVSCSQSEDFVLSDNGNSEEVTVSFSVSADDGKLSTRTGNGELDYISDGTKADMLVYAVYVAENGDYRLLEQYGLGTISADPNKPIEGETNENNNGQTIVKNLGTTLLNYTKGKDGKTFDGGYQFSLRLMRGKTYRIAFWAQNSECEAYETKNLTNVTVDYADAKNNDEMRDAFSMALEFEAQPNLDLTAVLYRVMAQVNVGTSGWDYNEEIDYGNTYLYSQISLTGVYNTFNAVTQEVIRTETEKNAVTYSWAVLPAYRHITDLSSVTDWTKVQQDEEFLYVKLTPKETNQTTLSNYYEQGKGNYEEGYFLKYQPVAPSNSESPYGKNGIYTEVFKYLSMCYVLAPTHYYPDDKDDFSTPDWATPLDEVSFSLATTAEENRTHIFTIKNVPIQRNWRTNILGGTKDGGEEDNTSIFDPREFTLHVDIAPGYNGEHNTDDNGAHWETWEKDGDSWKRTDYWHPGEAGK